MRLTLHVASGGGRLAIAALAATLLARTPAVSSQQASPPPTFKTGVELISVDVQVVGREGDPVSGLGPEAFEVAIDSKRRRVVSAEMVDARAAVPAPGGGATPAAPGAGAGATRAPRAPGRIYLLAIDQSSFRFGVEAAAVEAAGRFLERLQPEDQVGLIAFPPPAPQLAPTRDREPLRDVLAHVSGTAPAPRATAGLANLSTSDVMDVTAGDETAFQRIVARQCQRSDQSCPQRLRGEIAQLSAQLETQAQRSLYGLRGLLRTIEQIPGRKTVVLVSSGLLASDRPGTRLDLTRESIALARAAAAAGATLYVLQLDTKYLDAFSADRGATTPSFFRDASALGRGLELLAGASGGTLFRVTTGADFAFDRVLRETAAYYLLAIETLDADRDGLAHGIRVKVKQRGVTVRSRAAVVIPRS
jgi:VWFA-related protein